MTINTQTKYSRKGRKSFINTMTASISTYIVLMIFILSFVLQNTSSTLSDNAESMLRQLEKIYMYEVEEVLDANEQALAIVLQDNTDLKTFVYGTEVQRAVAAQNMVKLLRRTALSNGNIKTLLFYDLKKEN